MFVYITFSEFCC